MNTRPSIFSHNLLFHFWLEVIFCLHEGLPGSVSRVVEGPSTALGDLHKFTNYSVSVAASTRAGLGVASESIICSTDMDGELSQQIAMRLRGIHSCFQLTLKGISNIILIQKGLCDS